LQARPFGVANLSSDIIAWSVQNVYTYIVFQKSTYSFKTRGDLSPNRKVFLCPLPQGIPIAKRLVTISLSADGS
jgi:hypothetical protein